MIDPHSQTWAEVSEVAEKVLSSARQRLEATGLSLADTEFERGRIAAMSEIRRLSDAPKPRRDLVIASY